jgi:TRAP transporter TAXI family solute receptor
MKTIQKYTVVGILLLPMMLQAVCRDTTTYQIITGSKTGTYFQIGNNLAKYIAPDACIKLKVINSNGSLDNVYKLISPEYPRLKFAIVQNDVLQELQRRADNGEVKSKKLVDSLRVIKPLYNEEIHILTKADSSINNFGDLKGKKISIGKPKSGTAMTSMLLYKELFDEKIKGYTSEPFDKSLRKLIRGEIDAIIKVAGQPVSRLSKGMNKGAGKLIKLISYDEKNGKHKSIQSYYTTDIYSKNYHWIKDDVTSLSTKAFLVTYNYKNIGTTSKIKKFVKSLNDNLQMLQKEATKSTNTPHLKWNQVANECNPPLPGKWQYHKVINEVCPVDNVTTVNNTNEGVEECSSDDKILGLCK